MVELGDEPLDFRISLDKPVSWNLLQLVYWLARAKTLNREKAARKAATGSVLRPNYYLPPLPELEPEVETELENEGDLEYGSVAPFTKSDEDFRLHPDSPLPRSLQSSGVEPEDTA